MKLKYISLKQEYRQKSYVAYNINKKNITPVCL